MKPYVYKVLDNLFGYKYQELPGAKVVKETAKAYLINYCNQERWISKQFVKISNNKINIEKWLVRREFI